MPEHQRTPDDDELVPDLCVMIMLVGHAFWFWTVGHSVEARERIRDSRDMNEQLVDVQGPSRGVQAGHTSVNFGTNVSRSIHFEVTSKFIKRKTINNMISLVNLLFLLERLSDRSPVCPGKFPNFHCVVPVMVLADKYHNLTVILNFHDQGTLSCVKKGKSRSKAFITHKPVKFLSVSSKYLAVFVGL
ncbi:hypothetical protein ACH5RR_038728 [Cinchona calisaya]|uniref:Uncharacterized protein n=1 Tax=Cinchona calisaya TaxID=153742 RepID=A0ABD2Y088_9GENT